MAKPETADGLKSEARRAESGGVLEEGRFPSPSVTGFGERCNLSLWALGRSTGDLAI